MHVIARFPHLHCVSALAAFGAAAFPHFHSVSALYRTRRGNASYFFWTYFKQSRVTAVRIITPEKTNCRLVSMPRMVSA